MSCSRFFSCLVGLCITSAALSFVAPRSSDAGDSKRYRREQIVVRPQLHVGDWLTHKSVPGVAVSVSRDQLSGVTRLISGADLGHFLHLQRGDEASYLDIMQSYIAAGQGVLGVTSRDLRMVTDATFVNHDTAFYQFDVYRDDVKIEDATLMFRFRHGRLVQLVNRTFAEAQIAAATGPAWSDRRLRQLLESELGTNKYTARGYTWRVVPRDGARKRQGVVRSRKRQGVVRSRKRQGVVRSSKRQGVSTSGASRYELLQVRTFQQELGEGNRVQIDPHSGRVFEVAPSMFYSEMARAEDLSMVEGYARASVYPRWYREELVVKPLSEITVGFTVPTPAPQAEPTPQQELPMSVMTDVEGRYTIAAAAVPQISNIVGAKVRIFNRTGPRVTVAGIKMGDFWQTQVSQQDGVLASQDKIVAQSMVFHHTDYIFRLAAQYITPPWFDAPLPAHTNLSSSCNAHWDSRAGTINFYSGNSRCANTGLISDIIYHEWGHGLDAKTGGIRDGAYSEGFGDIMSMLITKSPIVGLGFGLNGRVVRNVEPDKVYPQDARGGVHAEGMVIGSTFWDLLNEFKKYYTEDEALAILRKYAFQMIFTAEKYTDVYDALLVIDDDDADLSNGTPNFCLINEPFSQHGLASLERRCLVISFVRNDVQELQGNGNRIIEPGERIELTSWVENLTDGVLENLRGVASSTSEHLNWENSSAEWQQVAAGETAPSSRAVVFTVDADATCGSEFNIDLDFDLGKRQKHFSENFLIGRSAGQQELYQGVGLPMEIPDLDMIEAEIWVDGTDWGEDTVVHAARLRFALKHTYHGDLNISLIAPDGEELLVKKLSGRGRGVLTFDEDISELLRDRVGRGAWRLRITDVRRLDRGILNDFVLTLTPKKFICNPPA